MPRKKPRNRKGAHPSPKIGEEIRIAVKLQLKTFLEDPSATGKQLLMILFYFLMALFMNDFHFNSQNVNFHLLSMLKKEPTFTIGPRSTAFGQKAEGMFLSLLFLNT